MKKIVFILIIIFSVAHFNSNAQQKKKTTPAKKKTTIVKKQEPAPPPKPVEPESPLTASSAGKYAKDFGKKMFNTDPLYGDKHTGYYLDIGSWKSIQDDDGAYRYLIQVQLSWKEGNGGLWNDWKDVSYKGVIMCDEYGCKPIILIKEKKETSVFNIAKRARKLEQETIDRMAGVDPWLEGIIYYWGPEGCLE